MTRCVIRDALGNEARKIHVERSPVGLVDSHQIFSGVVGVVSHKLSVWAADIVEVVLLQHITACGLRHDDVITLANTHRQRFDILRSDLCELLHVAAVKPRRATTASVLGQRALDSIPLVYLDQIVANLRLLILDQTGGKDGNTTLTFGDAQLWTLGVPGTEPLLGIGRQQPNARNAGHLFNGLADQRTRLRTDHLVG